MGLERQNFLSFCAGLKFYLVFGRILAQKIKRPFDLVVEGGGKVYGLPGGIPDLFADHLHFLFSRFLDHGWTGEGMTLS